MQQSSVNQLQDSAQEESSCETGQLWSLDALRQAQRSDPDIGTIVKLLESGDERPPWEVVEPLSSDVKTVEDLGKTEDVRWCTLSSFRVSKWPVGDLAGGDTQSPA